MLDFFHAPDYDISRIYKNLTSGLEWWMETQGNF